MDNLQILMKLEMCISIIKETDNVFVIKQLEEIAEALVEKWNTEDIYMQEIKNALDYDNTMDNLNNIKL